MKKAFAKGYKLVDKNPYIYMERHNINNMKKGGLLNLSI